MLTLLAVLLAGPIPAETRQLVLSLGAGWEVGEAEVRRFERRGPDAPWLPVGGPTRAALGRSGLGWGRGLHAAGLPGPVKREGDGRAPAGAFDLRGSTGYDDSAPAGARLVYQRATSSLRCVDDPRSRYYNQLVDEASVGKDWTSAEDMRREDDLYRLVVFVGHNDAPAEPGAGSCIFLHIRRPAPSTTAGCTAFEATDMEALLRWLDPAARPVLVQLPTSVYEARRREWALP